MRRVLPALIALVVRGQSPETLLADADRHRHPWPAFRVDIRLGEGPGEQRWRVHTRENGDAWVEGLSEKEKGRSVLVLGDDMWLQLPTARKPVKVSPQQRLMGPASGGDLARTRFREDYEPEGERSMEGVDGVPCHRVPLRARRASVTHPRAVLWLTVEGHRPVKAEFSFASGKKARTVRFEAGDPVLGRPVLRAMVVEGPQGDRTRLAFSAWAPEAERSERFTLEGKP